jgi:hypothetical protein
VRLTVASGRIRFVPREASESIGANLRHHAPGIGKAMHNSVESVGLTRKKGNLGRAIGFASKVVSIISGICAVFWALRASFRFSRPAGFFVLGIFVIVLYETAARWVRWLPGLLPFGVINAVLALTSHHAPPSFRVAVSAGVSCLLLAFYGVGCLVSSRYNNADLSTLDRLALLVYLFCMIWPIFATLSHPVPAKVTVTPVLAWSAGIGMAALIISFAAHHRRRTKRISRSPAPS